MGCYAISVEKRIAKKATRSSFKRWRALTEKIRDFFLDNLNGKII